MNKCIWPSNYTPITDALHLNLIRDPAFPKPALDVLHPSHFMWSLWRHSQEETRYPQFHSLKFSPMLCSPVGSKQSPEWIYVGWHGNDHAKDPSASAPLQWQSLTWVTFSRMAKPSGPSTNKCWQYMQGMSTAAFSPPCSLPEDWSTAEIAPNKNRLFSCVP